METVSGRSRFSKPLPPPKSLPRPPATTDRSLIAARETRSTLAYGNENMVDMTTQRLPSRRGADRTKTTSIASASSVYSDSPGFAHSSDDASIVSKDSLSEIESQLERVPSPPPKDEPKRLPQTPRPPNSGSASSPDSGLPPYRPEIWRRRSLKNEKGIAVTSLRLHKSNRATTNRTEKPATPPKTPQSSLPQKFGSTARKPVPARPAPPQPNIDAMGARPSKITDIRERVRSAGRKISSSKSENTPPNAKITFSPIASSTTHSEAPKIKSPTISTVTPISPDIRTPPVPRKSMSRSVGTSSSTTLRASKSDPKLLGDITPRSRQGSDTLTATSEPLLPLSPQARKTPTVSVQTSRSTPFGMISRPSTAKLVPTSTRIEHSRSRSSTVALRFPGSAAPPNAIAPAPSLNLVHLDCYQSHANVRKNRNTVCPVACMMCLKEDPEVRWTCTWCYLRVCAGCIAVLTATKTRDLRAALGEIGRAVE